MTVTPTRREITGYGLPRTTVLEELSVSVGTVAIVEELGFAHPDGAWMLTRTGWARLTAPRATDESIDPESGARLERPIIAGTLFWDESIWEKYGNPTRSTWRPLSNAVVTVDGVPGPTVLEADQVPGMYYTDLRADSSSWRYDDGEWVEVGASESGPAFVVLTQAEYDALDPADPDTLYVIVG